MGFTLCTLIWGDSLWLRLAFDDHVCGITPHTISCSVGIAITLCSTQSPDAVFNFCDSKSKLSSAGVNEKDHPC